jgi:hypothetical protein
VHSLKQPGQSCMYFYYGANAIYRTPMLFALLTLTIWKSTVYTLSTTFNFAQ